MPFDLNPRKMKILSFEQRWRYRGNSYKLQLKVICPGAICLSNRQCESFVLKKTLQIFVLFFSNNASFLGLQFNNFFMSYNQSKTAMSKCSLCIRVHVLYFLWKGLLRSLLSLSLFSSVWDEGAEASCPPSRREPACCIFLSCSESLSFPEVKIDNDANRCTSWWLSTHTHSLVHLSTTQMTESSRRKRFSAYDMTVSNIKSRACPW